MERVFVNKAKVTRLDELSLGALAVWLAVAFDSERFLEERELESVSLLSFIFYVSSSIFSKALDVRG